MKQNKDREEFEKINICGCSRICFGHKETQDKLWSWIETHTQKKVEEEREKCKLKMAQSNEWWNKKIGLLIKGDK